MFNAERFRLHMCIIGGFIVLEMHLFFIIKSINPFPVEDFVLLEQPPVNVVSERKEKKVKFSYSRCFICLYL